jgi:hypothetical protein
MVVPGRGFLTGAAGVHPEGPPAMARVSTGKTAEGGEEET